MMIRVKTLVSIQADPIKFELFLTTIKSSSVVCSPAIFCEIVFHVEPVIALSESIIPKDAAPVVMIMMNRSDRTKRNDLRAYRDLNLIPSVPRILNQKRKTPEKINANGDHCIHALILPPHAKFTFKDAPILIRLIPLTKSKLARRYDRLAFCRKLS